MITWLPFTQEVVVDCLKCQQGFDQRVDSARILEEQISKPENKINYILKNTFYLLGDFIVWNLQTSKQTEELQGIWNVITI